MTFSIHYNPEAPFNPRGDYKLGVAETLSDAIENARGYSEQYFGEISDIWVRDGRKKVFSIPRRGRVIFR